MAHDRIEGIDPSQRGLIVIFDRLKLAVDTVIELVPIALNCALEIANVDVDKR